MGDGRRNLLVNLAGALVVGLSVGYAMSVGIGRPPFLEMFPSNFLRAFVPYTLLAYAVFGGVVLLTLRGVVSIFGGSSARRPLR